MSVIRKMLRLPGRDENGIEIMQAVFIFGAAAIVFSILYKLHGPVMSWVMTLVNGFNSGT